MKLNDIVPLTAQQVFDNALFGLREQKVLSSDITGSCLYRGDAGRCGIGHSIPDALYQPEMDTGGDERADTDIGSILPKFKTLEALFQTRRHRRPHRPPEGARRLHARRRQAGGLAGGVRRKDVRDRGPSRPGLRGCGRCAVNAAQPAIFPMIPTSLFHRSGGTVTAVYGVEHGTGKPRSGLSGDYWFFRADVAWDDGGKGQRIDVPPQCLVCEDPPNNPELRLLLDQMSAYLQEHGEWKREGKVQGWVAHRKGER